MTLHLLIALVAVLVLLLAWALKCLWEAERGKVDFGEEKQNRILGIRDSK